MGRRRDDDDWRTRLASLLRMLRRRREATRGTDNEIKQTEIATRVGVSSGQVSRLEKGERSLYNLEGRELYAFLSGYHLSDAEIRDIVAEYEFNVPPQLLGVGGAPPGQVRIVCEGSVSTLTEPRPVEIRMDQLRGFDPAAVRMRITAPEDLATERAKATVAPDIQLVYVPDWTPKRNSVVIVEQDGVQALVQWPLGKPEFASPYEPGPDARAVLIDPDRLRVVGVAIGGWQQFPH